MTLDFLLAWWNLIFAVPFALGLLYMGLYIATGITFGDGDVDADAEVDADVDGDVDADADADADVDADVDGDVDADAEADGDADHDAEHHAPGPLASAMELLGVGRVPLSLVLMVLVLTWGLIGTIVNRLLWPVLPGEWMLPLASVPAAAAGSAFLTGGLARLVARLMPLDETSARPKRDLVGRVGEALFDINETFGMVVVKDDRGERYQLPCRTGPGTPPIRKGEEVLLVHYDRARNLYLVRPYELSPRPAMAEEDAPTAPLPAAHPRAEERA